MIIYDYMIGIDWTWVLSIDIIYEITFRGPKTGNSPVDKSKLGKKDIF